MHRLVPRAVAAAALLLALAAGAFAPPPGRPPPRPPAPRPAPRPAAKPPTQVRTEIRRLAPTRPVEAIQRLNTPEGRRLPAAQRLALAHQAYLVLRVQVESGGSHAQHARNVRSARLAARKLAPDLDQGLDDLTVLVESRLLVEALAEVLALVDKGRWPVAARRADAALAALGEDGGDVGPKEFRDLRAEARGALAEARAIGAPWGRLGAVRAVLREADAGALASLRRLQLHELPEQLRLWVRGLRALAEVRVAAEGVWRAAPDGAALREAAETFGGVLLALPGADPSDELSAELLQDLAVKALLEGHPKSFEALMPKDGPRPRADALLADVRALTLGKGTVTTWPALRALADGSPPAGLLPLLSASARKAWKAPDKGAVPANPHPLDRAVARGKDFRAKAEQGLKAEQSSLEVKGKENVGRLRAACAALDEADKAERQRFAEVEAALGRKLTPQERVRARDLFAGKKAPEDVAAALKGPAAGKGLDDGR